MERLAAPRVGQVTHHSIELTWEDALQHANDTFAKSVSRRLTGDARVKVQLEQRDYIGSWRAVYS